MSYERRVVAILTVTFAFVYVDMSGIYYLMPFIEPDLKLTNTQIGLLSSAYWLMFGISSYAGGAIADRLGRYKVILVWTLGLFAGASMLSGLANSFYTLFGARLMSGLLSGPYLPVANTILLRESSPERTGLNMGIMHNTGGALMGLLMPTTAVALATHYHWRVGFFLTALPSVLCVLLIAWVVHEPRGQEPARAADASRDNVSLLREVLRSRNACLCMIASCLNLAYSVTLTSFLPLYLIKERHFEPQQMALLLGMLGASALVFGIAMPAVSDRIGRRPTLFIASVLGMVVPLAAMQVDSLTLLAILMFVGWTIVGSSPLIFATVPGESVAPHAMTVAMGLTLAVSTLLGGVLAPYFAGSLADRWGLSAPILLSLGYSIVQIGLALALIETAPRANKIGAFGDSLS